MAVLVLRNLFHDLMWALLALAVALLVLTPSLTSLFDDVLFMREVAGFLVITVLPSVIVWTAFGSKGFKAKIPWALCCQVLVTTVSMALFYLTNISTNISTGILNGEARVVLLGFCIFAGLKLSEFLFYRFRKSIPGIIKRVLVVGDGLQAELMEEFVSSNKDRFSLLGRVSCPSTLFVPETKEDCYASTEFRAGRLRRLAKNFMADKVVVALAERRGFFPVEELLSCKLAGIEIVDAPAFYESATRKLLIENITPSWFIFSHGFKVTWTMRLCKRIMDITAALVGLILLIPVVPFVALAIRLDSSGPILFRQVRVGQGDTPFTLMKFRTMTADAESKTGAVWSQQNDPRITKVGNFLRKTRLDEIPQLLNILKGDMSLVGPRPERPEFVSKLKERIPYYSERHYVKPGLTGWAQVCYPYGSSVEDAIEKLRYDLYYIKNISIFLDIEITLKTVFVVILGKGR